MLLHWRILKWYHWWQAAIDLSQLLLLDFHTCKVSCTIAQKLQTVNLNCKNCDCKHIQEIYWYYQELTDKACTYTGYFAYVTWNILSLNSELHNARSRTGVNVGPEQTKHNNLAINFVDMLNSAQLNFRLHDLTEFYLDVHHQILIYIAFFTLHILYLLDTHSIRILLKPFFF